MILARSEVITKLEQARAGQVGAAALAAWAFELFYLIDQGQRWVDAADIDVIAAAFDELMFADDENFALTADELGRLIDRLKQP